MRCARTVPALCEKEAIFSTVFPDDQGDRSNCCVPVHRTTQTVTQSKTSDKEAEQTVFHPENAGLLSESPGFALWT